MHVLQPSAIGGKTLVERDGVTLVVLPVGDTRRNHPVFLVLRSSSTRWRLKNRGRRLGGTTGNLLVLEPWWLEGIFLNLRHLNDSLLPFIGTLVGGGVSNVGSVVVGLGDMFGLRGLDLAVSDTFEGKSRSLSSFSNRKIIRSFHLPLRFSHIGTVSQGDQVYPFISQAFNKI